MPIMPTEITTSATRDSTRPNPCCRFLTVLCIVRSRRLRRTVRARYGEVVCPTVDAVDFAKHLGASQTIRQHDACARERAGGHAQPAVVAEEDDALVGRAWRTVHPRKPRRQEL